MEKLVKFLWMIFALYFFASCQREEENREQPLVEAFKLEKIDFELSEGESGIVSDTITLRDYTTTVNGTAWPISGVIRAYWDYNSRSFFSYPKEMELWRSMKCDISDVRTSVPQIDADGKLNITNRTEYTYWFDMTIDRAHALHFEKDAPYEVPAYSKVKVEIVARECQIRTLYTATFREVNSGKVVHLHGEWRGIQYYALDTKLTTSPL